MQVHPIWRGVIYGKLYPPLILSFKAFLILRYSFYQKLEKCSFSSKETKSTHHTIDTQTLTVSYTNVLRESIPQGTNFNKNEHSNIIPPMIQIMIPNRIQRLNLAHHLNAWTHLAHSTYNFSLYCHEPQQYIIDPQNQSINIHDRRDYGLQLTNSFHTTDTPQTSN